MVFQLFLGVRIAIPREDGRHDTLGLSVGGAWVLAYYTWIYWSWMDENFSQLHLHSISLLLLLSFLSSQTNRSVLAVVVEVIYLGNW